MSPSSKHLSIRKGDWVYIPQQDEGGFQGKKIGEHLLAGAAAHKLTNQVNSDVANGEIKSDAPKAQLYNLKYDPYQTKNICNDYPEKAHELQSLIDKWKEKIPSTARLGWINLKQN